MKRSLILTALSFLVLAQLAWAQVPQTINYQGVLRDGGGNIVENGTYYVTFSIYDAVGATTPAWTSGSKGVSVTNGVFSVILGQDTSLPESFPSPAWLGIKVKPDTDEMPRIELTAVPFALQAGELNMPATERWYAIPAQAFRSNSGQIDSATFVYSNIWGTVTFYAPVHLPHGAEVTEFYAAIQDTAANNMNLKLASVSSFGLREVTTIASMYSTGQGLQSLTRGPFSPAPVVDNQTNTYWVRATWTVPSGIVFPKENANIQGVRIKYTVNQPLP